MDYKKLLESDTLSLVEISEMKNAAYSSMSYKFYLALCELYKLAEHLDPELFQTYKKKALDLLNSKQS